MLRRCWGGSKWLQLNRKEKKTVGIECHAGHLEVARKWREGNWHKPTRFPYFGTQAHALAPLGPSASPVHRQQHHPLFPVSCPACPGLACPTPACRGRERETERHREQGCHGTPGTSALIDPKALTGDLASRSRLASQVATYLHCIFGRIELTAAATANPSICQRPASCLQPTPTSQSPNLHLPSRSQLDDRLGLRPTCVDRDLDVDLNLALTYQPSCPPACLTLSRRSRGATEPQETALA